MARNVIWNRASRRTGRLRTRSLLLAVLLGVLPLSISGAAQGTAQELPGPPAPGLAAYLKLLRDDREQEGGGESRLRELLEQAVAAEPGTAGFAGQLASAATVPPEGDGGREGGSGSAPSRRTVLDPSDAAALLDLACFELERAPEPGDRRRVTRAGRVRSDGFDALDRILDGPRRVAWMNWMGREVVLRREHHPLARRRTALELLMQRRAEAGKLAILTIARDVEDPLRPEALAAMPGWHDEAVDLFLVGLVGRTFDKRGGAPHPFNLLLERVRDTSAPLGLRATNLLERRIAFMLISPDWRVASRGIELARSLDETVGVPLLLDALAAWNRRLAYGGGSKRVQYQVLHELQTLSGVEIGPNPARWRTWWIAVRQGKTPLKRALDPAVPRTSASFFGLPPVSDAVTFVLDLSGSMSTEWGTTEHTRYQEAIEQMMQFLQASGEHTRFNVILFNNETRRSSPELVAATTETLERARGELLAFLPDGGTRLRPAVELALGLDLAGRFELERLEADTVVVLCDGETAEGRRWVAPLLDRIQAEARVVFHCVQIGGRGDGTLEALAQRSGGEFLRVGG